MGDTGIKKYSANEALNRIYRVLIGSPEANDEPDRLTPEVFGWDTALSRIAELLEDSLPGFTFHLPAAAENDYGEIYTWTGTNTMDGLSSAAYQKITGSFQNSGYSAGLTPQPTSDRILLTDTGYFFVDWAASIIGSPDVTYEIEPYHGALGTPQAKRSAKPYSSGTATPMSGHGIFLASGTNQQVDLRVKPSATAFLRLDDVQLRVYKVAEY